MKIRKIKKQVPKQFRKDLYESYKLHMKMFGKPISTYKEWLLEVINIKL